MNELTDTLSMKVNQKLIKQTDLIYFAYEHHWLLKNTKFKLISAAKKLLTICSNESLESINNEA